jgi:predicted Zn-dependent protease
VRPGLRLVLALCVAGSTACGTLSVDQEKQLGHQAQREVRQQVTMMRDRVVVNYVRELGDALVSASDPSPFEFRFYVVEDPEINAFALPAGAIYIHTGVIMEAADASELAGVIAHEIAHVTQRHVAKLYNRNRNTGWAVNAVTLVVAILTGNPYIANAAQMGGAVAATAYTSDFGRDAERESDAEAVETLIRAGYDPNGLVTFFNTLLKEGGGGGTPQFLRSHPATAERIANVRAMIQAQQPLPSGLRRGDGGKLEIIQKRIELIEGTQQEEEAS